MDARVRAHIDHIARTSASIRENKDSVLVQPDQNAHDATLSQEDFETWIGAFRKCYAESLEYLQSH